MLPTILSLLPRMQANFLCNLWLFSLSVMSTSFATWWTVACQAPLSVGFSKQEYWSGLPFPSPGDLADSEIKLSSLPLLHCRRILSHWASREAQTNDTVTALITPCSRRWQLFRTPALTQDQDGPHTRRVYKAMNNLQESSLSLLA